VAEFVSRIYNIYILATTINGFMEARIASLCLPSFSTPFGLVHARAGLCGAGWACLCSHGLVWARLALVRALVGSAMRGVSQNFGGKISTVNPFSSQYSGKRKDVVSWYLLVRVSMAVGRYYSCRRTKATPLASTNKWELDPEIEILLWNMVKICVILHF
jgi:hypothetical protein